MNVRSRRSRLSVTVAAAAAATTMLLSGCTSGNSSSSGTGDYYKGIKIAFVSGPLNDNFFPPLFNGAKQAAKDLGVTMKYIPIDEADIEKTSVTTMETAIAGKPDAIIVGDFIPSAVDPEIKKAIAAGIPVYVDQSGQANYEADGAFGFIGQDPVKTGTQSGAKLVKAGSKSILCVINVPGNPYLASLCDGVSSGAKAAGSNAAVLNIPTADATDPTKVTADIGAYLKGHPDVDGVMTLNGAVGNYAIAAVKAAGSTGKIHIGSLGLSKVGLAAVKDGSLDFIVGEQPYLDGYLAVVFATQYVKFGLAPIGQVTTGPQFIDSGNVGQILKISAKYPGVLGSS